MFEPGKLKHLLDDEKPRGEVGARPYTLEHLAEWISKHPADLSYNWDCVNGACLFQQYGGAVSGKVGATAYMTAIHGFRDNYGPDCGEPFGIACNTPYTFGAALERTRAAIAARLS